MPLELELILRENVQPFNVGKGDVIQQIGTISDYLYFVEKAYFTSFWKRKGAGYAEIQDGRQIVISRMENIP
jgi:CRP-like cAMP-binding protein